MSLGIATLLAIGWRLSPYRVGVVVGNSMSPTLKPNQIFLIDVGFYRGHVPQKDDIVVFNWNGEVCVKRVVAGPGERVWLLDYSDKDRTMHPRYAITQSQFERLFRIYGDRPDIARFKRIFVPPGEVYVVGDHQQASLDSRYYGPISTGQIIGRVCLPEPKVPLYGMRVRGHPEYAAVSAWGARPRWLVRSISCCWGE